MFMYGSILIAVTLRPVVLSSKPVDEAEVCRYLTERSQDLLPITPLPIPLTTPPETRMYFILAITTRRCERKFSGIAKQVQPLTLPHIIDLKNTEFTPLSIRKLKYKDNSHSQNNIAKADGRAFPKFIARDYILKLTLYVI